MSTYDGPIAALLPNQVFVFGSNLDGFHGGGSAGYASFGMTGNVWRMLGYQNKPNGWKGRWNVKGIGEGYQEGTIGRSYAIPTVAHAGEPLSIPRESIVQAILRFYSFANAHPELDFLIAYMHDGSVPLNGYTTDQIAGMFAVAAQSSSLYIIPPNVIFENRFFTLVHDHL
jgi:hypothetical protein